MKYNFKLRPAEFGGFNNRWENMGSGGEKRKAIDLPVRVKLRPRELDVLAPMGSRESVKLSEFMYGPDPKKPQLQTTLLSPMKIFRHPENIKAIIYDNELDKRRSMTFEDCSVKDPSVEYEDDGPYLSFKLQIHPTWEQFQRVAENVEMKTRNFECYAMKPELFDEPEEEGGEGEDGEQADLDPKRKADADPEDPEDE